MHKSGAATHAPDEFHPDGECCDLLHSLPVYLDTYPPTETLAMFVAQVLNDDSSCQRAVNDRIVRCLQHGLPGH